MYLEFYGLKELPFELTSSSRFLLPAPSHREDLFVPWLTEDPNEQDQTRARTPRGQTTKLFRQVPLLEQLCVNRSG